jgi:hypothetical protein
VPKPDRAVIKQTVRQFLEQNRSKDKNISLSMKKDSLPIDSGSDIAMLVSD